LRLGAEGSSDAALVITRVERRKGGAKRYDIYINDEYAFSAHEDILVRHRLLKGAVLSEETFERAKREEWLHGAYLSAIRYLGRAMRSEKEVAKKLKSQGFDEETVAATIRRLTAEKLIDDGEYAAALARQRLQSNKKGKLWIMRELADKGVDRGRIEAALGQFDADAEFETAWGLAVRRWQRDGGEREAKLRRLAGFLERRGFAQGTIRAVLRKLGELPEDNP